MLHMVVMKHSPESCPGRPGNEDVIPCMHKMDELMKERGIEVVGRWADPSAYVNYAVLDAEGAHVIQGVIMESGFGMYSTAEIRPVLSMD